MHSRRTSSAWEIRKSTTVRQIQSNDYNVKKRCWRQISFEEPSSEEEFDESTLCDDKESDDNIDLFSKDTEMCLVCAEFGTKTELWFRCVFCGKRAHADCSGFDSAENYTCDFCSKN